MSSSSSADAGAAPAPSLDELRVELDRIDDAMHDLLMQRAQVVERVAGLRAKGGVPLRPGREAAILRRLLARHRGPMSAGSVVRIWRAIINAGTAMQHRMMIAVCQPHDGADYPVAAREQFGVLTPLRVHRTPAQAIRDVSTGVALAAVLPIPGSDEPPAAAWWTTLMHQDEGRLHIVGRLPFWATRPEGATDVQAFVVSAANPDPSGQDRTLIGMELAPEMSRARLSALLAKAGFTADLGILRRDPGGMSAQAMIDVEGFLAPDDPRLANLAPAALRRPVVLGAYAVPIQAPTPNTSQGIGR